MRKQMLRRILSITMVFALMLTMLYTPLGAYTAYADTSTKWTPLDGIDEAVAASEQDIPVAITMTTDGGEGVTYALPTAQNGSNGQPLAVAAAIAEGKLTTDGAKTAFGWAIAQDPDTGTYEISCSGGNLYVTATNNGIRTGAKPAVGGDWSITDEYLTAVDSGETTRYVGIYTTGPDWRCYTSINNNIANQKLQFWAFDSEEETEPEDPGEVVVWDKFTEAPLDGAELVVYHPASGNALTANASGARLAGVTAAPEEDKLAVTDNMAKLTVSVDNGVYTFTNAEGKFLTAGATGNSLTFADEASDYSLWTVEAQADGTWYLVNVNAEYNGSKQALEYYNGFTTYGVRDNNDAYKFDFYGVQGVAKLSEITWAPQDGAKLVIYHPASGQALTTIADGAKLAGTTGELADGKLIPSADMAFLDVTLKDGVYTFANAQGKYLTSGETGNSLTFTDEVRDVSLWTIEAQADGTWYLVNVTAEYNGNKQALEYYNGFTTYGVRDNNAAYKFAFYGTSDPAPEDPDEPEEPTGDDFGLVSKVETGDEVILYNAASGRAVGNTVVSNRIPGVALTEKDGVITTDNTDVVWTVNVNEDKTITLTQGDFTLGGVASGTYNNLVPTGATATKWTLDGPDPADNGYYMYLGDMTSSYGNVYLEIYNNNFTLYGSNDPTKAAYGVAFYKKGAEPEVPGGEPGGDTGDLITSLDQLEDGTTVAIYSPSHKTAISSKPNGDWYLKAEPVTITDGKVDTFTDYFVWTVKKNDDGTFSFVAYNDESHSITVWPSGNYAELSVDTAKYVDASDPTKGDNKWTVTAASAANCFNISSPSVSGTRGPAAVEAYVRNGTEVFSGYFAANSTMQSGSDFALQFYAVDPEDAVDSYDDGEWDGVLTPGEEYVIYNTDNKLSLGLFKAANYAFDAIPTEIDDDNNAICGNGTYAFKVDSMGRYYTFEVDGQYLATNNDEELFFIGPDENGKAPDNAKWFLTKTEGTTQAGDPISGYLIYNKDAQYGGTPVTIEYFSSVFSGWTYNTKNDLGIYVFNFHKAAEGTYIHNGIVQAPSVIFDSRDYRYVEEDYKATITLADLCPEITSAKISFSTTGASGTIEPEDIETSSDLKNYTFTIPAAVIDAGLGGAFTLRIEVTNGYGISYIGEKEVQIIDEPFFSDYTPAPNSQTREDKRPIISAKVGNVGDDPTFSMEVNGEAVEPEFKDGVLSYQSGLDMPEGRTTVHVKATRADGVASEAMWAFFVGEAENQLYFGQLHSHTTYSDGSGSLDTALEYFESLPESANVQFVAFTDHSNYFDSTSAANPADAVNDKSLMTDASRKLWEEYKGKAAAFNAEHRDLVAIAGFEMTWSGGPGHINTFDSDGLVSRNNADLNNKSGDAGMKLYYESINKGDSLSQFNHPGTTFGNFTDFSYWDEETDDHIFLVEVGNGEGQIGRGGYYPSYEEYILALDKGWHVAPTNNQDNHKGLWGNANDARDVILADSFGEEAIYNAIRELKVYATEDKNLELRYTMNGFDMGTIFDEDNTPETLKPEITFYDSDETDKIKTVEIVANGGTVVKAWDDMDEIASGRLTAELEPDYSYYFVRVTEEDGDIAVTAPVWTGQSVGVDIDSVEAPEIAYVGQETTLTTTFSNKGDAAATVKSIAYTTDGGKVIGTDTASHTVNAGSSEAVPFTYTPDTAKVTTVTVTAVVEVGGIDYTFKKDVEFRVRADEGELPVTAISEVQAQTEAGIEYAIEGVVTSNASGYDKDTAFFDCIYVQDETAGICCFPVSGEFKVGDKVHVEGYSDFFQGEPELQVDSIEVIGEGSVEPTVVTAAQINDQTVRGSLVTLKGKVESVDVVNGLIQTIMVKDAAGDTARVFIDGYITTDKDVEGCVEGADISATGLASYDDTFDGPFPRIRVRNRADIVCTEPGEESYTPEEVDALIDALPKDVTTDDLAAIEQARKAYDSLTDEEKASLAPGAEAKIEAAEAKVEAAAVATLANTVVTSALGHTASSFTSASYKTFNDAINAAKALLKDPAATPGDYLKAAAAIADAESKLVARKNSPMTAKAKKKTTKIKYSKLKKKSQKITKAKAFTVKNAKGTVSFKKVKGNSKITVSKTGKITVKKGLKRKTYTITVKVTDSGNDLYKPVTKTVKLKIKVK